MEAMLRGIPILLMLLLAAAPAVARAQDPPPPADPFVALDDAKLTLGAGRLEDARKLLTQIPAGQAEPYVDEEVVLQRMLLNAAFLDATNYVYLELGKLKLPGKGYEAWLRQERDAYASALATDVRSYMQLTEPGYDLSFARFRLPLVTDDHLQDVQLYTDRQVLTAAAQNWDDGREGLGKGVILAQARVAVALGAAVFYDMPRASASVAGVSRRLAAGVPLYPAVTMDWIAETCFRLKGAGNGLEQLSKGADARLQTLLAGRTGDPLHARMQARLNPPKPAVVETKPKAAPTKKKGKGKRRKRR
jgi:hypothetical protein